MDAAENMPRRIKLELRTLLEQFFLGGTLISPIFIFIGHQQMNIGDSPALMLGAIVAFMLSLLLLFVTDNYYLLDLDKRALLYRFKFMFFERLSKVSDFSGVHAVTVDIVTIHGKYGAKSYFYIATLVLFNGRVLPVSDRKVKKVDAQKLAEFIAKATGATYVQSFGTSEMVAVKAPAGRYTFKAKSKEPSAAKQLIIKILALLMILVCVAFLGMLLYLFVASRR
ncbi:MAG: hypothetical protein KKB51_00710 [Candidatus Riflebacteria bacterium]|nr:hypothetical protein [Candidatus Riflebacteria bacterium]